MTPEERELLTLKMKVKAFKNKAGWENSIFRKVLRIVSVYFIILAFAVNRNVANALLFSIAPTLAFGLIELLHPLIGKLVGRFIKFDE